MNLKIGKIIASSNNPIVLAEAGVNHNGSILKAERLINNLKKVTEKLGFEPNNTYIYINKKI